MKSKKGQIGTIQAMIVPLAAVAILLVVGFLIMAEVKTQSKTVEAKLDNTSLTNDFSQCVTTTGANCSYGVNSTITLQKAMDDIPGYEDMDLHASSEGYLSLSLQLLALL